MEQFYMFDAKLKNNNDLDSDGKLAYMYLYDRMKSSVNNKQFFDAKKDNYYVIYTIDEMMNDLNVGRGKVIKIYKQLVNLGLLIKSIQYAGATKLFLPKFENETTESSDFEPVKVRNSDSNHSHLNQSNKSEIYTSDTDDRPEKPVEKWRTSIIDKLRLPELAVDQVLKYTKNDVKRAYKIIGLINKAKSNVARLNGLTNSPIAKYENNANIRQRLATRLMHIFSYSKTADNESAYIMNGLKTFFKDAFGLVKDEIVKPVAESKIEKRVVPVPDWMDNPQEDIPVPTEESKAKIREMLKHFD